MNLFVMIEGGGKGESFYDIFPEIQLEAQQFIIEQCAKKEALFTAATSANFFDNQYYEITNLQKVDSQFVRPIASCKLDLRRFGAKFASNSERPYFLGHERADVVQHREQFVQYFMQNENHFYTITNDAEPTWKIPKTVPMILICKILFFFSLEI